MSSTVCLSGSPSCGWRNLNLLLDLDVFLQFSLMFPWVQFVWLDSKCLQFESLSRHVFRSFIIYALGLKQFSHQCLWRRRFRLFWVSPHNSTCDSLLWRMSRVCASMLTCLCSSGILHGSPKSKYSRFRKQSKAFIVCLQYVWRIL